MVEKLFCQSRHGSCSVFVSSCKMQNIYIYTHIYIYVLYIAAGNIGMFSYTKLAQAPNPLRNEACSSCRFVLVSSRNVKIIL